MSIIGNDISSLSQAIACKANNITLSSRTKGLLNSLTKNLYGIKNDEASPLQPREQAERLHNDIKVARAMVRTMLPTPARFSLKRRLNRLQSSIPIEYRSASLDPTRFQAVSAYRRTALSLDTQDKVSRASLDRLNGMGRVLIETANRLPATQARAFRWQFMESLSEVREHAVKLKESDPENKLYPAVLAIAQHVRADAVNREDQRTADSIEEFWIRDIDALGDLISVSKEPGNLP